MLQTLALFRDRVRPAFAAAPPIAGTSADQAARS